jgi:pimeloyl-ACP methyl ester carboxylesterase
MVFGAGQPGYAVSAELVQWVVGLCLQASPKATLDCVRAFSKTDFRHDLRAVTVPTLIVHGDADLSVPIDLSAPDRARDSGQPARRVSGSAAWPFLHRQGSVERRPPVVRPRLIRAGRLALTLPLG